MEDEFTGGRAGINALGERAERDTAILKARHHINEMWQ